MSEGTSLTIEQTADVRARLARLATETSREAERLGAEAIEAYVDQELAIFEAVEKGREDVRAGRTVPHDDVMKDLRGLLASAP